MGAFFQPETSDQLRDCLRDCARDGKTIGLFGRNTKAALGGTSNPAQAYITTQGLRGILKYEPADLTVSVEAGMPFAELQAELSAKGQMLPLDGPFAAGGTVGGVVAANLSGPFRRAYGTARDLVIGMRFATVDGRLADTGGMVVKNVAGLDLSKLLIGSFGTLAAMVSVNFKVIPKPKATRTFLFCFEAARESNSLANLLRTSQSRPTAVESLNPGLSRELGLWGFTVAAAFGGNARVMERLSGELAGHVPFMELGGGEEEVFWHSLQMVTQRFLSRHPNAVVVQTHTPLSESHVMQALADPSALVQSGAGFGRAWLKEPEFAGALMQKTLARGWQPVVEAALAEAKTKLQLWPKTGGDFAMMERVKQTFDPQYLLNRGRLYDRI